MTTAAEIHEWLMAQGGWVDRERMIDRILHGAPDRPISACAVAWMGTTRVIRRAIEAGCDGLLVHEPIFWTHRDDDENIFDPVEADKKRALLDEHGITVIRCHDLWDRYPRIGVVESWAACLGFDRITRHEFIYPEPARLPMPYAIAHLPAGTTLTDAVTQIANRTRHLGQQHVAAIGDPQRPLERLALNVGAWGSHAMYWVAARDEHGAQGAVATEFVWWRDASWALDTGFALIHANHGVSECYAIEKLCDFVKDRFPDIAWHFINEAAPYTAYAPTEGEPQPLAV